MGKEVALFALVEFDGVEPSRTHLVVFAKDRYEAQDRVFDFYEAKGWDTKELELLDIQPMYEEDPDGSIFRA